MMLLTPYLLIPPGYRWKFTAFADINSVAAHSHILAAMRSGGIRGVGGRLAGGGGARGEGGDRWSTRRALPGRHEGKSALVVVEYCPRGRPTASNRRAGRNLSDLGWANRVTRDRGLIVEERSCLGDEVHALGNEGFQTCRWG